MTIPKQATAPKTAPATAPTVFGTPPAPPVMPQGWNPPTTGQATRTFAISLRSVLIVFAAAIAGLCLLVLGVKAGENSQSAHTPDAGTLAVLQYAQSHSDAPCYAVWGQHDSAWSVKCGDLR